MNTRHVSLLFFRVIVSLWFMLSAVPSGMWRRTPHVIVPQLGGAVPLAVVYGLALFLLGQGIGLYHHYMLSRLRAGPDRSYKIPHGGWFFHAICPHYFGDMLVWWAFAVISQHFYLITCAAGTTAYLIGRAVATREWYHKKFPNFPKHRTLVIPYVL